MNLFRPNIHSRLNKIVQAESNRNRVVLLCCLAAGFPIKNTRKSLFVLNEINVRKLGNGEVSSPSLYNTRNGARGHGRAREILADSLGLETEELFPEGADSAPAG